jgi:threonine/homoserine/homoserine lactone efflux protein
MRAFLVLVGLILSATGLLALMAHPGQVLPNLTWIAGLCLFYTGALALKRKTRRVFAGRSR